MKKSSIKTFFCFFSVAVLSLSAQGKIADSKEGYLGLKNSSTKQSADDRDGDGVKDKEDNCPDTKGPKKNNGCPEINIELWTTFYVALSDVYFHPNSDSLTRKSTLPLDTLVSLMKLNPGFILKISGYSDSLGTQDFNKKISERRAERVKEYLESKGIPHKRLRVAAFGEKMPKAPNKTVSGRATNRRVEFDLFY